jgi:predicted 3-demethylubiquinone-9 3-methyltransferase (glyoxalase superfamily)
MTVSFAPFIWYTSEAEEAAAFYASVVPNSRVDRVTALPVDSPSGPAGSVRVVEFTLAGTPVMAFTAGPHDTFNDAVSMVLSCDSQAEVDRLWSGLLQGGGREIACGWLHDRFGLRWQIVPRRMFEMMAAPDRAAAARASTAMMGMVKLDLPSLEAAFAG